MSFDEKPLAPKQAGNVIRLFEQYLDPDDLRLDVPVGHDALYSSSDGGYDWCSTHGPIHGDDLPAHSRKRCELGKELREEYRS